MKHTIDDFADKIDSEGGTYGALAYELPIGDYDLPQNVVDKWQEMRLAFAEIQELEEEFWVLVDRAIVAKIQEEESE